MESSPLIKAHDHARAAAVATRQSSDTTVAINEHTLAAGEFANAAKTTSSVEALRTLKLLEEHHRKLAEILKLPPEQTLQAGDADGDGAGEFNEKGSDMDIVVTDSRKDTPDALVSKAMPPALIQRYASRETSSIASNLASARGIRSKFRGQPLSPSVSNDQAPGNVEPNLRRNGSRVKMQNIMENNNSSSNNNQSGRPAWVPPITSKQESLGNSAAPFKTTAEPSTPVKDDGGYARFYNTFGNLLNKISAPLAFAGLPLIQEEPGATSEAIETPNIPTNKPSRVRISPAPSITEPDMSKIYSRATLRALARDGHIPTDSFYVVPSTGHTMSYANILSYAEKEKRRLEASAHGEPGFLMHDDDDDFVDARESPASLSSGANKRRIGRAGHADRDLQNFIEELSLENKSLKDMLDKLTKRLHTFEASAQSMAESYRMMRPGSPLSSGGAGGGGGGGSSSNNKAHDEAILKKNHQQEEQLSAMAKQMERLEKDNRKMQKTLEKYREKWETLKAGAKARREAQVTTESIEDTQSSVS